MKISEKDLLYTSNARLFFHLHVTERSKAWILYLYSMHTSFLELQVTSAMQLVPLELGTWVH